MSKVEPAIEEEFLVRVIGKCHHGQLLQGALEYCDVIAFIRVALWRIKSSLGAFTSNIEVKLSNPIVFNLKYDV